MQASDEASFRLAHACAQSGRLAEAGRILRTLLARTPHIPDAKAMLCKICVIENMRDEAASLFRSLESDARRNPRVYALLGDAYLQAGRIEDALAAFLRLKTAENAPAAARGIAECQLRLGHIEDAAASLRGLVAQERLNPATLPVVLATALCTNDRRLEQDCLRAATRLPHSQAIAIYGTCTDMLVAGGKLREAMVPVKKKAALSRQPTDYLLLANLRLAAQDLDGAEAAADKTRAIAPDSASAMNMQARCHNIRGDANTAVKLLKQAIAADPDIAAAYDNLSQIDPTAIDDKMRVYLKDSAKSPTTSPSDRPKLLLALGRAEERAGDYDPAFNHFMNANALLAAEADAAGYGYAEGAAIENLSRLKTIFTAPAPTRRPEEAADEPTPIFIIGMPRSGTSLLEQILSSHTAVCGCGELPGMVDIAIDLLHGAQSHDDLVARLATEAPALAGRYLASAPEDAQRAPYFTDKHPMNFWSVGAIKALFPKARIIHIARNPADTCLSIFKLRFYREYSFANDLDSLAHYCAVYEHAIAHWRAIFEDEMFELTYESLTEDSDRWTRELVEWYGLDWKEACREFYKAPRTVLTHSAAQVRTPINRRAVGGARKFAQQMEPFERALKMYRSAFTH